LRDYLQRSVVAFDWVELALVRWVQETN